MKKLAFIFGILMSSSTMANTYCSGKVKAVALNPGSGHMKFNYGYGHNVHCNVNVEYNNVQPEACKVLFSQLLAAQLAGKTIEARYNDDFECSTANLGDHVQTMHTLYQIQIID